MLRSLLLTPLLVLLGCSEKTPCEAFDMDRKTAPPTCVFASRVDAGKHTFTIEDGTPIPFEVGSLQHPTGLKDGPSLWARPWGAEWLEFVSDPDAESSSESQRVTVRADSLGPVVTVHVSMDELHYALGMEDGRYLIRSMDHTTVLTGRVSEGTYKNLWKEELLNHATAFAFPSDSTVAVADGLGSVTMLSLEDGSTVWGQKVATSVKRLTASPDGRRVAATSRAVSVWEADTGTEVASWKHGAPIGRLSFTEDGDHVVVRLRGVYVPANRPSAVEVNSVSNSADNVRRANSRSHGGYTPPDLAVLWRVP